MAEGQGPPAGGEMDGIGAAASQSYGEALQGGTEVIIEGILKNNSQKNRKF